MFMKLSPRWLTKQTSTRRRNQEATTCTGRLVPHNLWDKILPPWEVEISQFKCRHLDNARKAIIKLLVEL